MNARSLCGRCALLCALCAPLTASAQTKTEAKQKPKEEVITLSGCVERAAKTSGQYTLEDKTTGVKYRLTGTTVRDYIGKPVLVVGSGSKKLVVVGGLTPTPNVAAQAGAMDPARAAVQAQSESTGTGSGELPEFKVKSVRPGAGGCR